MHGSNKQIDPSHQAKRKFLRTVGLIILFTGIILLVIGISDFFQSTSMPFGGGPKLFGLNFLAIPLLFVGGVMTSAGYMGAAARYHAQEIAPVAKDTFNYMADGTSEGVKTIARSIHDGLKGVEETISCKRCGHKNPANAVFCNQCGTNTQSSKQCSRCGGENPAEAVFCNHCGAQLE